MVLYLISAASFNITTAKTIILQTSFRFKLLQFQQDLTLHHVSINPITSYKAGTQVL